MTTKYEYAQTRAAEMEELRRKYALNRIATTGRVIVTGENTEHFGDPGDPRTSTDISPELSLAGKTLYTIFMPLAKISLRKSREGNRHTTLSESLQTNLKKNKIKYKRRPDVTIFDRNGPVTRR